MGNVFDFIGGRARIEKVWREVVEHFRQTRQAQSYEPPPPPPPPPLAYTSRQFTEASQALAEAEGLAAALTERIAEAESTLRELADRERGLFGAGRADEAATVSLERQKAEAVAQGLKAYGSEAAQIRIDLARRAMLAAKAAEAEERFRQVRAEALTADRQALALLNQALELRGKAAAHRNLAGRYLHDHRTAAAKAEVETGRGLSLRDSLAGLPITYLDNAWRSPTARNLEQWREMVKSRAPEAVR